MSCTVEDIREYLRDCIQEVDLRLRDAPDNSQVSQWSKAKRFAFVNVLEYIKRKETEQC